MDIIRENGSTDKINFSLCIYIVEDLIYKDLIQLIDAYELSYKGMKISNEACEHNYCLDIDMEQNFGVVSFLSVLDAKVAKDVELEKRYALYCTITSEYDHTGVEIAPNTNLLLVQGLLNCSLNISCIYI